MTDDNDLVTVLEIDNPVQQSLAEEVLADNGIDYIVLHEGVQHIIGAGQLGGRNVLTGPVVLRVRPADAERARQLITEVLTNPGMEDNGE
jgi:hypothetical protein